MMKHASLLPRAALLCAALSAFACVDALAISTVLPSGEGTVASPYSISTMEELAWVVDNPASWSANFLLAADINASVTSTWTGATNGWMGIGRGATNFTGVFDGGNHTVSNITISAPGAGIGFFVNMDGQVKNLKLTAMSVTGGDNTGGLASSVGGTVAGCSVTGAVNGGADTGGLIGNMGPSASVSKSSSSASVTGTDEVGGLVGWGCEVVDSFATGAVTGDTIVGGLVGNNDCAAGISRSFASGNVSGIDRVGGLEGLGNGLVDKSYATGNVTASGVKAGGIVGENFSAITDSYAKGMVSATDSAGGVAGTNESTITRVYSFSSDISSTTNVGGLVGSGTGTVVNSYWDKTGSGVSVTTGGGTGVLTAPMKNQATYVGWNFTTTWEIVENSTPPTLQWQGAGGGGSGGGDTPSEQVQAPGINLGCFLESLWR